MTFITITATVSSLAYIQRDLHSSSTTLVWVASAYTLAVAGLVLSAGSLGDLVGRRTVFLLGVVVMAVRSLTAFAAGNAATVIAVQAIIAGVLLRSWA